MKEEKIKLNLDNPISFYRDLSRIFGSIYTALYFQQLYYWSDKGKRDDGYIFKTKEEIEEETTLTRDQQDKCRKELVSLGVLTTKRIKAYGNPTLHYKIDSSKANKIINLYYKEVEKSEEKDLDYKKIREGLAHKFKNSDALNHDQSQLSRQTEQDALKDEVKWKSCDTESGKVTIPLTETITETNSFSNTEFLEKNSVNEKQEKESNNKSEVIDEKVYDNISQTVPKEKNSAKKEKVSSADVQTASTGTDVGLALPQTPYNPDNLTIGKTLDLNSMGTHSIPVEVKPGDISHFIGLFKVVNPTGYLAFYKNKTQRASMEAILKTNSWDEVRWIIETALPLLAQYNLNEGFVPTAKSPYDLQLKYEGIKSYIIKRRSGKQSQSSRSAVI